MFVLFHVTVIANHGAYSCFKVRNYFLQKNQISNGNLNQPVGNKRTRFQRDWGSVRTNTGGNRTPRRGNGRGNGGNNINNNNNNNNGGTGSAPRSARYVKGPPGSNSVLIDGVWREFKDAPAAD